MRMIKSPRKKSIVRERLSPEAAMRTQLLGTSAAAHDGAASLPQLETQFRPLYSRRFRIDFAYPSVRLGIEVDGAIWSRGAHIRPAGRESDMLRDAVLSLNGWTILRFSSKHVYSGLALEIIVAKVAQLTGHLPEEALRIIEAKIKTASSKRKRGKTKRSNSKGKVAKHKLAISGADGQKSRKRKPTLSKG
jgi:very-short-patch-repair endonuclease